MKRLNGREDGGYFLKFKKQLITSVLQGTLFFRNKKLNLGPAVKKQVSFELNMSTVYIS